MASILFLLCEIFRKICFFSSITQKSVFSLNQSSEPYRSYRSEPYRYRGRSLTAGPHFFTYHMDEMRVFPHSSVGKESACNAGDPGWIPGSGRSSGEGIGYPLEYSWASLVAQLVKNLPTMRETWVQSLHWEDPRREGKGYPLQYSGLENSTDCIIHGITKSGT